MKKSHREALGPKRWFILHYPKPIFSVALERRLDIVHSETNMVYSRASLCEKCAHFAVVAKGSDKLDIALSYR